MMMPCCSMVWPRWWTQPTKEMKKSASSCWVTERTPTPTTMTKATLHSCLLRWQVMRTVDYNLKLVIFKLISRIDILSISCKNALRSVRWMPQEWQDPINSLAPGQSVPKIIELTGHLGQWQALIYWPKPGFTDPNNWHNTNSTKFSHASRASGRALFTGPIGNWLANGVGPVLISQTAWEIWMKF